MTLTYCHNNKLIYGDFFHLALYKLAHNYRVAYNLLLLSLGIVHHEEFIMHTGEC